MFLLVVVRDRDLFGTSHRPSKVDPLLIVHPDAVLTARSHVADVSNVSGRRFRDDVPFGEQAPEARRHGSRR